MASLASAPTPLCSSPSRHRRNALPAAVRCRAHFHPQLGSHRHVSLALRTRRWLSGNQVERRMEQRKFGFIERKVANGYHGVVTRSSFSDNTCDISCFRRYNRHRMGRAWRALNDKPNFPWRGHLINSQSVKDGFVLHTAAGPDEPHVATTSWADTINENPVLRFCDPETGKMDLEGFLNSDLPSHPKLYRGQLKNGFRYIILPNKMPANRFEAHMEIHVGSVDEEDDEQGIAHMIEHVAFLGSTKREKLLSTGARSNAYTDFHHTVFHIHSPTTTEDSNGDILPSVLDALNEIAFHPKFLSSRIEKERRAILSELQMMNTMEYRIDCQLLQYLHSENKLSKRFPIGLEDQIKKWDAEKIQQFHERWYFPANVTLYIVGDISNVSEVIHQIKVFFENTVPEDNASTVSATSAFGAMANFLVPKLPGGLMGGLSSERASVSSNQSKAMKKVRHAIRPPVIHDWCIPGLAREEKLPQIFQHELIQNFSINLFCKVPVSQVKTYGGLRNFAMKRIFISAFQFRINRRYKSSNPPFTSVELDHSDSGREGCTVTTLTVTAEPKNWHSAIRVAVQEVRRLKEFGVTKGELTRYLDALIKDSEQLATMIDSISSIENLDSVMEQVALGNTIMDQRQAYESLVAVVDTITLEEVNSVGSEILEFISDFGSPVAPSPAAIVACVPARVHVDGIGETQFIIHPIEIVDAIKAGQMEPIEAEPELEIPKELISPLELEKLKIKRKPHFIPVNEEVDSLRIFDQETGITQRRLSNGIAINYKITDNEIRGGVMRLIVGGGRALENFETMGAVIVGVRTLSESGCVGNFSREQVELFCVNHSVNCLLESAEELISLEFRFMVKDKGMHAAFQLLHMVLEHSVWLEEAFDRTRQMHLSWYHSIPKTLERSTSHKLVLAMLNGDERFVEPTPKSLQKLTLQSVKDAVMNQFVADNMEVSIVGDFTESDIESCILDYLGTVQARRTQGSVQCIPPIAFRPTSDVLFQQVFIKDTDERACAYLAGPAPNRWGFDAEGKDLFELMNSKPFHADTSLSSEEAALPMRIGFLGSNQRSIRSHPLFFGVALSLLAEIINSRLFTTVRDSLGLTYDVSFELSLFDRLKLGWYVISVTSTPGKIYQAVDACKTVVRDLHSNRIVQRELDRAKRTLMMKHEAEMKLNVYWLGLMTHLQASSVPRKDISCIKNLNSLYEAATIEDIYLAYKHLKVDNDSLFSCIGIAGLQRGDDTLEAMEDEEVDMGSHHGAGGRGFSIMTRPTT